MKKVKLLMMALMMCLTSILMSCGSTKNIVETPKANLSYTIIDSINKTKTELEVDTKMFIAEYWKSANDVIQNEDREGGVFLIKGTKKYTNRILTATYDRYINYTIKFYVKDKKYKAVIENIYCEKMIFTTSSQYGTRVTSAECTELYETYPLKKGGRITGMYKNDYNELINQIKIDMESILKDYQKYITTIHTNNF